MDEQRGVFGCSLSAAELADRRQAWEAMAAARLDGVREEGRLRVRFRGQPGVPESLRALVVAERDCCGWARWEVTAEGDASVLEVSGPPGRIGALAGVFGL
jgi:hypothetical protein